MATATPAREAPAEIGTLNVEIPVKAELLLKPEHAQARPATPADPNRPGYRHSPTQYARFSDRLCALLGIEDLDDLSDAGSMLRYLVECAVMYDHEAYSDPDIADMVVGLKMHETCISESGRRSGPGPRRHVQGAGPSRPTSAATRPSPIQPPRSGPWASSSSATATAGTDPDPTLRRPDREQVGPTVASILYHGVTNYEGLKTIVFKDLTAEELKAAAEVDPHFPQARRPRRRAPPVRPVRADR